LSSRDLQLETGVGTTPRLLTPHFILAVILLGAAAVLAGPISQMMDLKQDKRPLALRKPLAGIETSKLSPYRVVQRYTLEPTVVDALGTDQYLHWRLEDTSVSPGDPLRHASLFITYYTGGRNLVPHTPDECYLGSGYQPAEAHENRDLELHPRGKDKSDLPVRVCSFVRTAVFNREEVTVVYTFAANGAFAATRDRVRFIINDPRATYAYFSKVEVHFPNASREESVRGAAKLYEKLVPVLVDEHLPDFDGSERAAKDAE
jgi:hypothetical protein